MEISAERSSRFRSSGTNLVAGDTNAVADLFIRFGTATDADADELPTDWETQFGLDPNNPFG